MRKLAFLLGFGLVFSVSTLSAQYDSDETGGDADAHGCTASAGYLWSAAKKQCVRLFEAGIALDPVHEDPTSTSWAYLIFTSDRRQVEVFLVNGTYMLSWNGKSWSGNGLSVFQDGKRYSLVQDGETTYRN